MRRFVSLTAVAVMAFACRNEPLPKVTATKNRPGVETRVKELCVDGDATEGFASFVVKNESGTAVSATVTTITQLIDGEAPGSGLWEGGQSLDEENLSSDLHVTLVLDASDSVVEAELFDQMKASAQDLLIQGAADWEERPGTFTWRVVWFNRYVNLADDDWRFVDIKDIPAPPQDDEFDAFTRLYSAMEFAIRNAEEVRDSGIAAGDRDNHLLAVFTDGRDNISGLPSGDPAESSGVTPITMAPYSTFGTNAIDREQLESLMTARPWLQVSMLGLGSEVDSEELEALAAAGGGTVFEGSDVEQLFSRAEQSFEILQTVGWRLPFNPGEPHVWRLDFEVAGLDRASTIKLDVERTDMTPPCEDDKVEEGA